jgi:hypothetical protein
MLYSLILTQKRNPCAVDLNNQLPTAKIPTLSKIFIRDILHLSPIPGLFSMQDYNFLLGFRSEGSSKPLDQVRHLSLD